jgi:cytochrome c-type protein NapC
MPTSAIVILILFSALLAGVLVLRPAITVHANGKILAFGVLFFLPLFCLTAGMDNEMERSKSTSFCLSCHIMEPYGKSLRIDDPSYLAAAHFQNHRVPADEACYTCHTNYAMFGTFKAKLGGLRHLYVHYLKTEPRPQDIQLHEPYNNR